jgi:hypothetical protein
VGYRKGEEDAAADLELEEVGRGDNGVYDREEWLEVQDAGFEAQRRGECQLFRIADSRRNTEFRLHAPFSTTKQNSNANQLITISTKISCPP